MKILTYNEWLEANEDLVDEVLDGLNHPSGVPYRVLVEIGADSARVDVNDHLLSLYNEQRKKDEAKLKAWEALLQ